MTPRERLIQASRGANWRIDDGLPYTVEILLPFCKQRMQLERQLLEAGIALPLQHHAAWDLAFQAGTAVFVCLMDSAQLPVYGWTLLVDRSRTLPGHTILRVQRYGATTDAAAAVAGLTVLSRLSEAVPKVLRLRLEVFSADVDLHGALAERAVALGYRRILPPCNCYQTTIRLELDAAEDVLFNRLSRSARRNIQAPTKKGLQLGPVTDPRLSARLDRLTRETFARSGGRGPRMDWAEVIEFSAAHPRLSRIVGCRAAGDRSPEGLLSFAWGCRHGDLVSHTSSASTRVAGSNLALSYATAWQLINWARELGCRWFDFGGVTEGTLHSDDALGGISDFKRFFSNQMVTVGAEWVYEPTRFKGVLADSISAIAERVRGLQSRR